MPRINATTVSFISWRKTVDKVLERTYAITIEDAGIGDQQLVLHWKGRESPEEFVTGSVPNTNFSQLTLEYKISVKSKVKRVWS